VSILPRQPVERLLPTFVSPKHLRLCLVLPVVGQIFRIHRTARLQVRITIKRNALRVSVNRATKG
jgi:hypothetical protein